MVQWTSVEREGEEWSSMRDKLLVKARMFVSLLTTCELADPNPLAAQQCPQG